jgi:hypothetical protein
MTLGKHARSDGEIEWTVFFDHVWLRPSARSDGWARATLRYLEPRYRALCVDRLSLRTEGRGNYKWASLGFAPTGGDSPDAIARRGIESLRAERDFGALRDLSRDDWTGIDRHLRALELVLQQGGFASMRDLSQFGRDHEFRTNADLSMSYDPQAKEEMTVGKEVTQWIARLVLYSTSWSGERRLTSRR